MKIVILGKFQKLHDEEYIARSFESIGHDVLRIPEYMSIEDTYNRIVEFRPKFVLYFKLNNLGNIKEFLKNLKAFNIKTVCWVFDLYIGYAREFRLNAPAFKADYFFSTDGGHENEFKEKELNHRLLRQGVYKEECYMEHWNRKGIVFVGSDNPLYQYRNEMLSSLKEFGVKWHGRFNTDEVRGRELNQLYGESEIVIGDSVYSPYYWSNRVVETLGRGGFLIHPEIEGIKDEYPYLVTYKHGDFEDLKSKIRYYLTHPEEREEIRQKNFDFVKNNYTMDKKCRLLIDIITGEYDKVQQANRESRVLERTN